MSFSTITLLGSLIYVVANFLKAVSNKKWNSVITQAIVWGAGVLGVFLVAHTTWGASVAANGVPLARLNWAGQLLLGLSYSSVAGVAQNTLSAVGVSMPALLPKLAGPKGTPSANGAKAVAARKATA